MIYNLNKTSLIACLFFAIIASGYSQVHQIHVVKIKNYSIEFETIDLKIDGKFKVFNSGSKIKKLVVEGEMKNNYRSGTWKIYDTLDSSSLLVQREYFTPFRFKPIIPEVSGNPFIDFIQENLVERTERDSTNCLKYDYVAENDFIYSKRIFREIMSHENRQLKQDELLATLLKNASLGKINTYGVENFSILYDTVPTLDKLDSCIGFRIKEDFFVDKKRMITEYRILGISPIIISKKSLEEKESYWFYYPYIRHLLAEINCDNNRHLDDLFVERDFFGRITGSPNKDFSNENLLYEDPYIFDIELLLMEHEYWLMYAGYGLVKE